MNEGADAAYSVFALTDMVYMALAFRVTLRVMVRNI